MGGLLGGLFVLNLVELEWGILTENDGKMLAVESVDYIVIKKWGLRGEFFYLE